MLIHLPMERWVISISTAASAIASGKAAPAADFRGGGRTGRSAKRQHGEMQIFGKRRAVVKRRQTGERRSARPVPVNFVAAGRIQPGPGRDNHWEGSLSDLQISGSRALTAPEVQTLMYSSPAPGSPTCWDTGRSARSSREPRAPS